MTLTYGVDNNTELQAQMSQFQDSSARQAVLNQKLIRMSFIARYVYTYKEFVFVTGCFHMQQSDRTKIDNKRIK